MSKTQKGNKEKKKPKADKDQPKSHVSAYKAAQGQGKPSFNPFARKGGRCRLEFDALKDFGQLIFALQSLPRFRSGIDFADRPPFVRTVRCRTVANTLRSDLMSECSAGKSKKASSVASRSFVRQATALSYLAPYLSANMSIAAVAAARVGAP